MKNKKKLTIIHLAAFPYVSGGIDTWLYNFITYFQKELNIHLICPSINENIAFFNINDIDNLSIKYIGKFSNYFEMLTWSYQVYRYCNENISRDEDIIILSTIPTMIPIYLFKLFGKRHNGQIICSVRGQIAQDAIDVNKSMFFKKIIKIIEKLLLKKATVLVANGWDTQDYLSKFYSLDSVVIPNAYIDTTYANNENDNDINNLIKLKNEGKKIILHLGTLRPIKGISFIIDALEIIQKYRTDTILVFVGKGQIEYYKNISIRKNMEVLFTGEKRNIHNYFDLADVVINVSGGSGVSNSLLEALSRGKTVVSWNIKTFNQVLINNHNGYLANFKDIDSLSKVINYSIDNPLNILEVKKSIKKFTWDQVSIKWKKLLKIK